MGGGSISGACGGSGSGNAGREGTRNGSPLGRKRGGWPGYAGRPFGDEKFVRILADTIGAVRSLLGARTAPQPRMSPGEIAQFRLTPFSRCFAYDSLKRLQSAQNPESGTVTYTYDSNGNLIGKQDADLNLTCFGDAPASGTVCPWTTGTGTRAYDGLNRPQKKAYKVVAPTAPTSDVTYTYDHTGDTKGTLYSVTSGTQSTVYTHDLLGRVTGSTQTTAGQPFPPFSYAYSLSDQLTDLIYPSGRHVKYAAFDAADRVTQVQNVASSWNYANIAYTAPGGLSSLTLHNGISETYSWNDRLQQTGIQAGSLLNLHFYPCDSGNTSCSNNNGNIWRETVQTPGMSGTATQEYRYDGANRLVLAVENPASAVTASSTCTGLGNTWCQQYGYDTSANRWVSQNNAAGFTLSTTTPTGSANFDARNRLNVNGSAFDSAGNMQGIAGYGFTYDAENRMTGATVNGAAAYVYDGEGRRVQKVYGGVTTTYVYDAQGQLAEEYPSVAPPAPPCTTCYLTADHLGSTRLVTDGTTGAPVSCHDYLPFGEAIPGGTDGRTGACYTAADGVTMKFTGKERDAETGGNSAVRDGLDYFGARYFSGAQGRWTSVDPAFESERVEDPQTWNRYSYVYNRPLTLTDPDGRCPQCPAAVLVGGFGAVIAGGATAFGEWYKTGDFSWRDVGAAAGGGFVSGFAATATLGVSALAEAGLGTTVLVGAGSNVVGGVVERALDSPEANTDAFDPLAMGTDGFMGGAGSALGELTGQLIRKDFSPRRPPVRKAGTRAYARASQTYQQRQNIVRQTSNAANAGLGAVISNALWKFMDALVSPAPSPAPPRPPRPDVQSVFRPCAQGGSDCGAKQ